MNCLPAPLTEREKRLVSILEIIEVERHAPRRLPGIRYPGHRPLDRQTLVCALVANFTVTRRPETCTAAYNRQSICADTVTLIKQDEEPDYYYSNPQ